MRTSIIKKGGRSLLSESPKSEHVRMTISQEITRNHQRTKKGNKKTINLNLILWDEKGKDEDESSEEVELKLTIIGGLAVVTELPQLASYVCLNKIYNHWIPK